MSDLDHVVAHASRGFAERFGRAPVWAASAPGRVNLIGEHTDYNQGFVLPMAIDRWCVCVAAPAAGERSRVCAHDIDETIEVSLGGRESLPNWARYLVGSIVEHAEGLGLSAIPELDMLATTNIPIGGGLSSSAAIETAAAVLLEQAVGCDLLTPPSSSSSSSSSSFSPPPPSTPPPAPSPAPRGRGLGRGLHSLHASCPLVPAPIDKNTLTRALDCQRAEHNWAGVPCGLMDQLASSCGVADHALLIDCRDNTLTPVPMPREDDAVLLVINSGVHHELAASEYAARRVTCEQAARALGISSLRQLDTLDAVDWSQLDVEQSRCVRHVVSENTRTLAAAEALRTGDLPTLGRLMLDSHASLRDDYRVSCSELDTIVELATACEGVFGTRMTGGGFGGCAIVLAAPATVASLTRILPPASHARTDIICTIEQVRAVVGAGPCRLS